MFGPDMIRANERGEHPLKVLGKSLCEKDRQRHDCDDAVASMEEGSLGKFESKRTHSASILSPPFGDADDAPEDVSTTQACSSDCWSEITSAPDLAEATQLASVSVGPYVVGPSNAKPRNQEELWKCCPAGHILEEFQTTNHRCICDQCRNRVPKGMRLHGCRTCNYDVCRNCRRKNSESTMDRKCHAMLEEVPELIDVCPITPAESLLFPGLQLINRPETADSARPESSEVLHSLLPKLDLEEASWFEPSTLIEVRSSQAPEIWEQARVLLVNYREGKYKVRMSDETTRWVCASAARFAKDL